MRYHLLPVYVLYRLDSMTVHGQYRELSLLRKRETIIRLLQPLPSQISRVKELFC